MSDSPDPADFAWDPFGSLHGALWIGGAQWAGKSTVSRILSARYGLTAYHYDYHDARGHAERRAARRARAGLPYTEPFDPENWVRLTPPQLAEATLTTFADRLEFVFDDVRALDGPHPILAEGIGLRPEVFAPLVDAPDRMIVMVPTEEFRQHQIRILPRAGALSVGASDPALAQANRVERDRILAGHAVRSAREHGVRVLEVDGSRDAEAVADEVAAHFAAHLPSLLLKESTNRQSPVTSVS